MKKIYMLLCFLVLFVACGKKEYETLSKRDVAIMLYQGEVLGDSSVQNMIHQVEAYLESKASSDVNAAEQLDLWSSTRESLRKANYDYSNRTRSWWVFEKVQYPLLEEVFGKESEGVNGNYRLYLGQDEQGETVSKDILTESPFTGIAIFRTKSGKIEKVLSYEKGVQKELLMESTFYNNNVDVYSMKYFRDGELYKERFYKSNGEFKSEEFVN